MSRNHGWRNVVHPDIPDEAPELTPISGLTLVSKDRSDAEYTANSSSETSSDRAEYSAKESSESSSERAAITAEEPLVDDPFLKAMNDWSGTGRGPHVEFNHHEIVPLKQGRFLGRGAVGDVHETSIEGFSLAWKRMIFKRKVNLHERKEIEILKKLSHVHMIQLVGTYTHRQHLGILLYPVALCDLSCFIEDVEDYCTDRADDIQTARLTALGYFETLDTDVALALPIYTQIGCLVSAISYLHSQKIRHKDLKPSNILLSPKSLYLSDFGTATDFSLLSGSATDNEKGTPRYYAPEVAEWKASGRAADIFSLGCILLEILVLHHDGTLGRLRLDRSTKNTAYHANLENMDSWLPPAKLSDMSSRDFHLARLIRSMLSGDPTHRPVAEHVLSDIDLCDRMISAESISMFGSCCRTSSVSKSFHDDAVSALNAELGRVKECDSLKRSLHDAQTLLALEEREKKIREFLEIPKATQRIRNLSQQRSINDPQNNGEEQNTVSTSREILKYEVDRIIPRREPANLLLLAISWDCATCTKGGNHLEFCSRCGTRKNTRPPVTANEGLWKDLFGKKSKR